MISIISHRSSRITRGQSRHTYIVDVGRGIEIQVLEVSSLYENKLALPPYPVTRFFEIEIDEIQRNGTGASAFQHIQPVKVERKPDWHFLRFRIWRGKITVTERIPQAAAGTGAQWIYSDDFHLMFLSSGGRYDAASLLHLVTSKLDTIVQSILTGDRILSEFENQQTCREAFTTMFSGKAGGDLSEAVIFRQHASAISEELDRIAVPSGSAATSRARAAAEAGTLTADDLHIDITQIEELRDTSWLVE